MSRVSCYTMQFQYADEHQLLNRTLQMPGDADWSYIIVFYNMYLVLKNIRL